MSFSSIDEAIEAIEAGEMVIVVDDENRENEGDLVVAAEKITAEHIAFMMKYARGLICVPLPAERLDKLEIPLMVTRNSDSLQTAFTVSVDCKHGSVRLLTNNPTKIEALRTSGVIVSSRQSLIAASSASNITYFKTKRDRFGHLLDQDTSAEHVGRSNVFSVFGAQVFSGPLG
ncbi:3,4-dihydroxy-2-butanone 4-phosphate synthase [Rhizobium leguminosarum]|uniref:3,4-dihydroxy-2-butanone-4-phosphate synthase n=1 Tax=Rhizobium leguminosarum TaxID=384 RepID=UPI0016139415|nr:3,4-dihydroxy-2-butanone-4-phosphate synthase [Rhizobium leguminosarum]MBB5668272.1 3,4-dihydroxy-2-butanone 4-phosphate synthase [Rhizobium leguminosarum]